MFVARNFKEYWQQDGQKMLFVHTPKCGGSFVSKAFEPYQKKCVSLTNPLLAGHLTWREYRDRLRLLDDPIDSYLTFSVIRNPFDWHVSWYSYIRKHKGGKRSGYHAEHLMFQKMDFADYVDWLEDPDALRTPRFEMGRPIADWLVDETGTIAVQEVLRQENLDAEVTRMKDQYGLRIKLPEKRVNTSNSKDFRTYYTPREVDVIARRHAIDLEMFDYSFE